MKAVILDGYTSNPGDLSWKALQAICDVTIYDRTPKDQVMERIGDCEIVITNKTKITRDIIEQAPNIQYIGILATGYNTIDIEAAKDHNIPVCNVPSYSTDSVAQLVFAFILEICHHVGEHTRAVKEGQWTNSKDFSFWNYPLIELKDKTLGIIGFGSIGQAVSKIAHAFGMHVVVYNRSIKKEFESDQLQFVSLSELYQQADIITLHVPLTDDTLELINQEAITQMKEGVILINTARGAVINEEDVKEGLNAGKIAYAGLDVANTEPLDANSPLLEANNLYITPHIAWGPKEARARLIDIATKNVKSFIEGKGQNIVNDVKINHS